MSPHLSAEVRRTKTVEAVLTLAGQGNPSEITTAAIAEHMNVTQGALFRHFPSKAAIWQAAMEWVAETLLDRIDTASETAATPVLALRAMFFSHVAFVIEHPGVPRLMFTELQQAGQTPAKHVAHTLMQRYAHRVSGRLEQAKSFGEVGGDTDPKAAAILFIGMIQGLVMQSMLAGTLRSMEANAPGVLSIYLRGLGAAPGAFDQ
jgi:AcrR family transcriptional regulator